MVSYGENFPLYSEFEWDLGQMVGSLEYLAAMDARAMCNSDDIEVFTIGRVHRTVYRVFMVG